MQDVCHIWTQLNRLILHEFLATQWIERLPGVREGMCSIPVGNFEFSLSHARAMMIITCFKIFIQFKLSDINTNHCRVGLVTVNSLAHCSNQDFIELFCSLFIVLGQQTQQMSHVTSHLRCTFVQVELHQLLYQTLKKQWTKVRVLNSSKFVVFYSVLSGQIFVLNS